LIGRWSGVGGEAEAEGVRGEEEEESRESSISMLSTQEDELGECEEDDERSGVTSSHRGLISWKMR
jgi:hypothetical protein